MSLMLMLIQQQQIELFKFDIFHIHCEQAFVSTRILCFSFCSIYINCTKVASIEPIHTE